jgi:hypothetical protein
MIIWHFGAVLVVEVLEVVQRGEDPRGGLVGYYSHHLEMLQARH